MEKKVLRIALWQIRFTALALVLLLGGGMLVSFKVHSVYTDLWEQLGISKQKGSQHIHESFLNGYLSYYGVRNVKSIMTGDKAAVARDLMQYAKEQIHSEAFRTRYEATRRDAKPEPYNRAVKSKEAIRAERIAETEKGIRETEATLKQVKPDMAKAIAPVLDVLRNNLKEYKDPNSKMIDMMHQGEVMNFESEKRSHEERLRRWEKEYPEDFKVLVRTRLQHFVEVARTVDFSAALKEVQGKKKFVNPAYEGKSHEWKMIFRAGKEVIEPAIAFAEQWIRELQ